MSPKNSKIDFKAIIKSVNNAISEADISRAFVEKLIEYLGYKDQEIGQEKKSDTASSKVDFSLSETKKLPSIFIEVKISSRPIIESVNKYDSVLYGDQISKYIHENPGRYRFGIITNGKSIAIYRNYFGRAVQAYRETVIDEKSIANVFSDVKSIITKSRKREPLILGVFNNKGGVGKTSISYYMARTLAEKYNKKVLVMDFDPLQGDLTRLVDLPQDQYLPLIEWITKGKKELLAQIKASGKKGIFPKLVNLHCVYADTNKNYKKYTKQSASITKIRDYSKKIRNVLKVGFEEESSYDFVIIDSPPGWWFYSMLANAISDLVIIPVTTTSESSWLNSIRYLRDYLPDLKNDLQNRIENGPQPLPFLYNQVLKKSVKEDNKLYGYTNAHSYLEKEINSLENKTESRILKNILFNYEKTSSGSKVENNPFLDFDHLVQSADIKDKKNPSFYAKMTERFSSVCEFYFPELKKK
jgi:cellulose biosynthesis protein BcsQ